MADRNEVFRIILEGRDKLSGQLDGVRRSVNDLDKALDRLKRNKIEEFPLFGGGKATRGPGGQFIKKEELSLLDQARVKVDNLNRSISKLRQNRIKEGEFPLFGGGRAVRGDDGRFVRVQDVSLLDKAKARLNDIDKALIRIRTRIRRGPLVEGEEAGAGATRLTRNAAGQFVRAADINLVQRMARELRAVRSSISSIRSDTRTSIFNGFKATLDDIKRLNNAINQTGIRIRDALFGTGRTRPTINPNTGIIGATRDATKFRLALEKIISTNERVRKSQEKIFNEAKKGFGEGFSIARQTEKEIRERTDKTSEEFKNAKLAIAHEEQLARVALRARQDRERAALRKRLEDKREEEAEEIEDLRAHIRALGNTEDELEEKREARREIRALGRRRREREASQREEFTNFFQTQRAAIDVDFANKRSELDRPDIRKVEEDIKRVRAEAINADTAIGRFGQRAGLAFGDIVRGARNARKGMRDIDRDISILNNGFVRFGFAVGQIFKNFNQLVNLRWLFLTGLITIFFNTIVQLGTALVALAASAIQAGAALGGAFAAGVAQAIPVVGLLAAAMSRFNTVLDAVKLDEKLNDDTANKLKAVREAGERLADQQYNLKQALQGVADAQYSVHEANENLTNSYKKVRDATKDLADAKIQAARDIVDANLEEKDAALSLREAELGVLDAKKKLREEENKKRKSAGDLDEARAAIREAQDRLKIAKQQGDQSEISGAQQQLTIAQQNLSAIQDQIDTSQNDLKEARLNVERSQLTVEQARVRNRRAIEDAQKARQKGVKDSDVVKNAQASLKDALEGVKDAQHSVLLANRNVAESLHQVTIARRELADAHKDETEARKGTTAADEAAKKAYADLAPAEKVLFNSLKRIRKTFHDVFAGTNKKDGILGPITLAISRALDAFNRMMKDPELQRAAKRLAGAIGDGIDRLVRFVTSSQGKRFIEFFINQATKNIPKVVDGILNLGQAFLNVAKIATPIFNRLLEGAVKISERIKNATDPEKGRVRRPEEGGPGAGVADIRKSGIEEFLGGAEKHLDAWLKLAGAITRVIIAITTSGAATTGQTLVGRVSDALNNLADWINTHDREVTDFFQRSEKAIERLAKTLGTLAFALIEAFSSDDFANFGQVMVEIIIPGLLTFIKVLGVLSSYLIKLLEIPIVGDVAKWIITFLIVEKSFNKILPVTQKITDAVSKLGIALFKTFRRFGLQGILTDIGGRFLYARDAAVKFAKAIVDNVTAAFGKLKDAAVRAGTAMGNLLGKMANVAQTAAGRLTDAFSKAAGAVGGFITRIRTAAALMAGRLISAIKSVSTLIYTRLLAALAALRISVRLLVSATVIGALITAGILLIQNWDKVKKYALILANKIVEYFKKVVDWVKENWKKILIGALLAPFLLTGVVLLAVYKFRNKILGVFTEIGQGIKNRFADAFKWVREKVESLGNWVTKKLKSIPLVGRFFGDGKDKEEQPPPIQINVTPKQVRDAKAIATHRASGGVIPGHGAGDTVPAMLTPGEWVLNANQQKAMARALGITVQQVKAMVFGTNSKEPPIFTGPNNRGRGFRGYVPTPGAQLYSGPRNKGRGFRGYVPGLSAGPQRKSISFADFNLVSQTDPNGVEVWFLEMADGTFGQVTSRDATKIQNTKGTWVPNYVKRNSHGYKQKVQNVMVNAAQASKFGFSFGGVVPSAGVQKFAAGGVVQAPGGGGVSRGGNTINQNFNVKTEGETDWNYVMRLGAVHAQESF